MNTPHTPSFSERDALLNERTSLLRERDEFRQALEEIANADYGTDTPKLRARAMRAIAGIKPAIASAPTLFSQRNALREALKRMTAIAAALVCNPAARKAERECHASEFSQAMNQARVALRTEPDKANAVEVVLAPCQICGSNAVNPRTRHCMKCGRPQRIS